jgi:hypothetical protein
MLARMKALGESPAIDLAHLVRGDLVDADEAARHKGWRQQALAQCPQLRLIDALA